MIFLLLFCIINNLNENVWKFMWKIEKKPPDVVIMNEWKKTDNIKIIKNTNVDGNDNSNGIPMVWFRYKTT
jgi:hypothetical protein